jgi:hypothetical protein
MASAELFGPIESLCLSLVVLQVTDGHIEPHSWTVSPVRHQMTRGRRSLL